MTCCQCEGIEREFDAAFAKRELKRYRRKGLRKSSQLLVDSLLDAWQHTRHPDTPETVLDIGGGVGGIQLALLKSGARRVVSVDASASLAEAAREEAARQDVEERIERIHGDFVQEKSRVDPADIVCLDRVICCYDDMPELVGASADRARYVYGLVYPRDTWWTVLGSRGANLWFRLRRSPMRTFIHSPKAVDSLLRQKGLELHAHQTTPAWRIDVYRRRAPQ